MIYAHRTMHTTTSLVIASLSLWTGSFAQGTSSGISMVRYGTVQNCFSHASPVCRSMLPHHRLDVWIPWVTHSPSGVTSRGTRRVLHALQQLAQVAWRWHWVWAWMRCNFLMSRKLSTCFLVTKITLHHETLCMYMF